MIQPAGIRPSCIIQITRLTLLVALVACSAPRPHYYFSHYAEIGRDFTATLQHVDEFNISRVAAQDQEAELIKHPVAVATGSRGTGTGPKLHKLPTNPAGEL